MYTYCSIIKANFYMRDFIIPECFMVHIFVAILKRTIYSSVKYFML